MRLGALVLLGLLFSTPCWAVTPVDTETQKEPRTILASDLEELNEKKSNFSFNLDDGIGYRKSFSFNGSSLSLQLYGPVVKKKPGFKLRITQPGESDERYFEMRAYGNGKKQGIRFKVTF